jgi:WhiB family redox-sensing transcriptional regulator
MTLPIQLPYFEGRAACAEVGGDSWYPEKGDKNLLEVRRVCNRCEIQAQCLQWALETDEPHGIWGGLSKKQRSRLQRKRKQRPIKHGTEGGSAAHRRRGEQPCHACTDGVALARRERKAGAA